MGTINHRHVTTLPDNPASDISSDEWNDALVLRGADLTGAVIARDTSAADGWSAIASAAGVLTCAAPGSLATFRPLAGTDLPANLALTSSLAIGASPATTGAIRLANNGVIITRTTTGVDATTIGMASDNRLYIGDTAYATSLRGSTINIEGSLYPGSDNTMSLGHSAARWANGFFASQISIGTLPAQTGAIRLASNDYIAWRRADNGDDIRVMQMDGVNDVYLRAGVGRSFVFSNAAGAGSNQLNAAGTFYSLNDNTSDLGGAAPYRWRTGYFGTSIANSGYYDTVEMTAPAAPAANGARVYADDSGGKTRLMVRFNTGAAVQIAIEP